MPIGDLRLILCLFHFSLYCSAIFDFYLLPTILRVLFGFSYLQSSLKVLIRQDKWLSTVVQGRRKPKSTRESAPKLTDSGSPFNISLTWYCQFLLFSYIFHSLTCFPLCWQLFITTFVKLWCIIMQICVSFILFIWLVFGSFLSAL